MSKRLPLKDVEPLMRKAMLSEGAERDAAWESFTKMAAHIGLSSDKPEDGWKLAFTLYRQNPALLGAIRAGRGKPAGRKPTDAVVERDALTILGIGIARLSGDARGEHPILRDLASANGWPASDHAVGTLWRRLQDLKNPATRKRQHLDNVMRKNDPSIADAIEFMAVVADIGRNFMWKTR